MKRAVAASLLALLCGCGAGGGDSTDAYCDLIAEEKSEFLDLAAAARAKEADYLTDALALFRRLQEASPTSLRDEWDTVVFAWADLVDVLEEAGADPGEFDPETRPPGVTDEQFTTITAIAAELSSVRVQDAGTEINLQAAQVCDVDLTP